MTRGGRPRVVVPSALAGAVLLAASCAGTRGAPQDVGLVVASSGAGDVVVSDGAALLLDELVLRNHGDGAVTVLAADGPAGRIEGDALLARLVPRARAADRASRAVFPPGARGVLLVESPAGAPASWTLSVRGTNEHGVEVATRVGATSVAAGRAPVVVGPPLTGGDWLAENGPTVVSGHRRAVLWGRVGTEESRTDLPRCAQRFAVDFFRADAAGRTARGDVRVNENHFAWDAEVVACADAVVARAADGVPDNVPDPVARAVEMSRGTVAGNHVVLDLGGGAFAFYAHLRAGSVAVREGDRVRRGDPLGRLGNSGNSTEPHLHFHVADGASPTEAEGLPWAIDGFVVERGAGRPGQRSGELPPEGAVLSFGPRSAASGLPRADTTR